MMRKFALRDIAIGWILMLALLVSFVPAAWAQPELGRVEWKYRDESVTAHPTFVSRTDNGSTLVVLNGYQNPKVIEVDNSGNIIWQFSGIQANSAVKLANGNTLITDSGAPGKPFVPRVIEVNPEGQVVWEYSLGKLARAPRYAVESGNGNILVTLPHEVIEVTKAKKVVWSFGSSSIKDKNYLAYPVQAVRLANGNTLITDKGYRGGRVLEVDSKGKVIWQYGNGSSGLGENQLVAPSAAIRTAAGITVITDLGAKRVLEITPDQKVARAVGWNDMYHNGLPPVLNEWYAVPLSGNRSLLTLTYTSGRSSVLELNDWGLKVYVDDKFIFADVPPFVKNGRTLIPLRAIFETLGAQVDWDGAKQSVTAWKGDRVVYLTVGSNQAFINGEPVTLDVPAEMTGSRTMVPLRFVSEALEAGVKWDETTKTVSVTSVEKLAAGQPQEGKQQDFPLQATLEFIPRSKGNPLIKLTLTNQGDKELEYTLPTGQNADFVLLQPDGSEVWRWSSNMKFTQAVQMVKLSPGETVSYQGECSFKNKGKYILKGYFVGDPQVKALRIVEIK